VGELSPPVQVKLLRFLQDREFQRLGSNKNIHADVRVISATNRDLEARVKEGAFREDLYYRLNVVVMSIPPLRERREDIPLLIDHFMKHFSRETGKIIQDISWEAKKMLLKYDYPGNVRELENIMERAVVISRGPMMTLEDLPFHGRPSLPEMKGRGDDHRMKESIEALEHRLIEEAMRETHNNQTKAADILGISERMLRYKLKKYNLKH
jgi:transcriptional regulator with PAS, ATPase and Fis domain